MIKSKKALKNKKLEIDLTGPQGNAFVLLGIARKLALNLGKTESEIDMMIKDMKSGNYPHLIQVFEKNFGDFVILYQ